MLEKSEIRSDFPSILREYESDCNEIRDSNEGGDFLPEEKPGFIAEVTLSYPKKLHKQHRSFPLAPEKRAVSKTELSKYQKKCLKVLGSKIGKTSKLIGSFYDRKKYVLHASNLKLYLKLGMKLKKVHRVLVFNESNFLKKYINFCTEKRSQAKSDFEKRLFKLMSNSNFGKFIENSSKYLNMKLVKNQKEAKKWISNPNYHSYRVISDTLVAIFLNRKKNVIKQAYGIGFSILDLSKEFMFDSFYNVIRPALGNECEVLFSDTDSLFIKCKGKKALKKIAPILDTSNFPNSNPMFRQDRKAKLGYFKSEVGPQKITKFVGLRSKCYAFKTKNNELEMKCKGLSKSFKKNIGIEHYERCLKKIQTIQTNQKLLRSKNNTIQLIRMNKNVLSSYDDKHYLLNCGICSVPFNSIYIKKNGSYCKTCEV